MSRAKKTIAANEHFESSDSFRKRIASLPSTMQSGIKPLIKPVAKQIRQSYSDPTSVELSDVDFSVWSEGDKFKRNDSDEHSLEQELYLIEPLAWMDDCNDYGLVDLFHVKDESQCEVDEEVVNEIIRNKTKNKLYEIFLKQCRHLPPKNYSSGKGTSQTPSIAKTGKRDRSPEPGNDINRTFKTPRNGAMGGGDARTRLQSVDSGCVFKK